MNDAAIRRLIVLEQKARIRYPIDGNELSELKRLRAEFVLRCEDRSLGVAVSRLNRLLEERK